MRIQRRRQQLAIVVLSLILIAAKGCPQQDRLAQMTRTLGHAIAQLVTLSGDTDLGAHLQEHTDKAVAAIEAFQPGGSIADAVHWLNFMIDDLKAFPQADHYRPLIVFALGTIAHIIEELERRQPGAAARPDTEVRLTKPPTDEHELRLDWDAIRAGSPGLQAALIL